MEGDGVQTHDLFTFEQAGVDANGHAIGHFSASGIRPRVADRIEARGISLPPELFVKRRIEMPT